MFTQRLSKAAPSSGLAAGLTMPVPLTGSHITTPVDLSSRSEMQLCGVHQPGNMQSRLLQPHRLYLLCSRAWVAAQQHSGCWTGDPCRSLQPRLPCPHVATTTPLERLTNS